jgi:hypothetical protein
MVGDWGMNNFYLYRLEGQALSRVLPWDKDSSLRGPDFDVWNRIDRNVILRRALEDRELHQTYVDALKRCAEIASRPPDPIVTEGDDGEKKEETPAGPGWLERQVTFIYDQIRNAAREDYLKPFDNERFEDEIAKKLEFARSRAAFVLHAIDADRN